MNGWTRCNEAEIRGRARRTARGARGFTLIELMIAVAIVATLAGIAIPAYAEFVEKAKVAKAIRGVELLQTEIYGFYLGSGRYPDNLAEVNRDAFLDPWERPYVYLNIVDNKPGSGFLRKDRNLVPVNSDYDLYSIGRDGKTATAFTSGPAQDDIVRANNGGFIGQVRNY